MKYESELSWLAASNDNESSVLKKENFDLHKNVLKTARFFSELRTAFRRVYSKS